MTILNICENGNILSVIRLIKIVITIIKIVVPILLIISVMLDYAKAVSSSDNDLLAKANKIVVTKIIAAMLIFFIPTFVSLISNIAGNNPESFLSCFKNATSEKIDEFHASAAQKLVNKAKDSLNSSDYNIAMSSVRKLKNKEDRERMENELYNIKEIIDENEKQMSSVHYADRGYWWPIGSRETTNENGIIYAKGSPSSTSVNSLFGYRIHPVYKKLRLHAGIDIGASSGENVIASKSGKITEVVSHCKSTGCKGYGNMIKIKHDDGTSTKYAHLLQKSVKVKKGDYVNQGQVIALVGSTGTSTGPHLHFEVIVSGTSTNPLNYVSKSSPR